MKAKEEKKEKSIIEQWKEEYGKIYNSLVCGHDFIFRRIKRPEYSEIMANKEGADVEERVYNRQKAIVKLAVLNHEEALLDGLFDELAGLAISISEEILDKSGFTVMSTIEL